MEEGERIEMHAIIDVDAAAPCPRSRPSRRSRFDAAAPTPDAGSASAPFVAVTPAPSAR
jgi:hypothetical protein